MDKKCSRTVLRNKLERTAVEARQWWSWLFKTMETNASIPPHRREHVLKEVFPEKIFEKVLAVLGADDDYDHNEDDNFSSIRSEISIDELHDAKEAEEHLKKCTSHHSHHQKEDEETDSHELRMSSESVISRLKQKRKEIGPKNPYLRFQNRRLERAAIWYPKPPLLMEGMNLIQKSEAITEQIAYDFVEWLKTITDPDEAPSNLTVSTIKKMFNIGFNTHAAKSLSVKMKEMASVPESVAKAVNVPEMSRRNQLRRQIHRDVEAAHHRHNNFAFGTKLPNEMMIIAPKVEDTRKWLVCDNVPKDLESMATVWRGITHLRSTRAYCQYLLENPHIPKPKFLVECRLLDPTFVGGTHVSIESDRGAPSIMPPGVQDTDH